MLDKKYRNKNLALFLAEKQLSILVQHSVALEGIKISVPDVNVLINGEVLESHTVTEHSITMNQAQAWRHLFERVRKDDFRVTKHEVCNLHSVAARYEARSWGEFRSSQATISDSNNNSPEYWRLDGLFDQMVSDVARHDDPYERAITVFMAMARNQFFYLVNKRIGRLMMNGVLLSAGCPVISVPDTVATEFHSRMLFFYQKNDPQLMKKLMYSCINRRELEIMKKKSGHAR